MKTVLLIFSCLLFLTVLFPLVRNDYWVFRVFEFPRYQKWWICGILMAVTLAYLFDSNDIWVGRLFGTQTLVFVYLSYQIFPFTPFAKKHLRGNKNPNKPNIRFVISNVYQYNRKQHKLIAEVTRYESELMVFVETDNWWKDQLKAALNDQYPHQVLRPIDNTYGMLLFSKLPIKSHEVRYLIKEGIPSFRCVLEHEVGEITFFAVHPEPPVPGENLKSTARDKELAKVAEEAKQIKGPVVVAGDLNDVAWSFTTEEFVHQSGLYDPRRGRGMFSTFHAKYPFLRWPLDHLFCSNHFQLNRMRCLRSCGSDHLPIYVDLALDLKA
ncbi:endonuclease/exonuclease/phosphatase family protein [Marinoscillum sp.]|uniref:endonuclease/exonuclease/phosphatase family protein n=1 Tax=Marinoscillum sp. TaxID=2024838 RepID=UPI003BA86ADA